MIASVASLREKFGRRLRELRVQRGFNQLYLAELVSTSEDFISQVERGLNAPSFATIEAFADALEVDVSSLFTFPVADVKRQRVRMGGTVKKTATARKQARKRVPKTKRR
jgi:transcriptional regulator with XRE-family HTH domain